jgi:hypothetical protein
MRQTSIHGARHSAESKSLALQYCTFNLAVTKKTIGDGEKVLTYLNSVLKVLLGTDIFPRVPKQSSILFSSKICKYTHFFTLFSHLTWLSKTNCGWWIKTTYIVEFSVQSSIKNRYLPLCAKKKKLNFVVQWNMKIYTLFLSLFSHLTWLSQKNRGWWRKTTYIFEFSIKSSIRIRYFSSREKKKLNFVDQCYLPHRNI